MAGSPIAATEAVKFFAKSRIQVQEAKAVKLRDKENPNKQPRDAFETKMVDLKAEHILAATDFGDRVVITTINGRKYEASK